MIRKGKSKPRLTDIHENVLHNLEEKFLLDSIETIPDVDLDQVEFGSTISYSATRNIERTGLLTASC